MLAIMSGKIISGKATKDDEAPAEDSAEKIEPAAKKSGKKKLVLLAAPVVLLIGVGAGLWFTGILPGLLGIGKPPAVAAADKPIVPVFVDLPDLIANLASPSTKPYYVKL